MLHVMLLLYYFFFNDTATTEIYTLSLHDALPILKNIVDCVSISLNAPSKEEYNEISKPIYGLEAFDSLLNFAKEAKENIKEVKFSVVDVITEDQIERCKEIANSMGIQIGRAHV